MIPPFASARLPAPDSPGAFGARRKFDVHTGVDLYVPEGTTIVSMTEGRIVDILPFTGPSVGTPWWKDTFAVLVESEYGTILYGEIAPDPARFIGEFVSEGAVLGTVLAVLEPKRGRTISMLHVELYATGVRTPVDWSLDGAQPEELGDPTDLLRRGGL